MSSGVSAVTGGSAVIGVMGVMSSCSEVMDEMSSYSAVESDEWSSKAEIDSTLPSAAARKFTLATADAGIGAMRN